MERHKNPALRIILRLLQPERLIVLIGMIIVAIVVMSGESNFGISDTSLEVASRTPGDVNASSILAEQLALFTSEKQDTIHVISTESQRSPTLPDSVTFSTYKAQRKVIKDKEPEVLGSY